MIDVSVLGINLNKVMEHNKANNGLLNLEMKGIIL